MNGLAPEGLAYSIDAHENVNLAGQNGGVVKSMRALLHSAIANQTRLKSLGGTGAYSA